jgi:hypothetical protein
MGLGLEHVDWEQPWLAPYRRVGEPVATAVAQGARVAEALNGQAATLALPALACGYPLRFVPQAELPGGEAYEAYIHRTAQVPTRDNLHDFFNGLVWLTHPRIKRQLNALQAQAIAAQGIAATRGAVRDALTLFDENAAWLQADARVAQALRERDWQAAFITHRALWGDARLTIFGHALLEKLTVPRKPITAHAWLLPPQGDAQAALLPLLTPEHLATKPHTPLPVLGVPGWWPGNEPGPDQTAFYADATVFRPARR